MAYAQIISGAISGGGAMQASAMSAKAQKQMYQHRYQWTMKDLRKAGLNPMLAIQQGAPVPNSPNIQNVGEAAVRGAAAGQQMSTAKQMATAQVENVKTDTALKLAQTNSASAVAASQLMDNEIKAAQMPYAAEQAHVKNEQLNVDLRIAASKLSQQEDLAKMTANELANQPIVQQLENEYKRWMNEQAKLKIPEAKADAEFWNKMQSYGKDVPWLLQVIGTIKTIVR